MFQRPYVWNQEENWEPMWRALVEVFERRLVGKPPRSYFMGALVLAQVFSPVGTVPPRELIDGQQRMTTLQLLMACARDLFEERGFAHQANMLLRLTQNDMEQVTDEQFKVWPTNIDREPFRLAMTGQTTTGTFAQARTFFTTAIREWLGEDPSEAKKRAGALELALRHDLLFVAIDLQGDDDGQLIFETLNSLGTPLLPSDLVKNLLFRLAAADGVDTESLYATVWEKIERDTVYWRAGVRVGRRERIRLDIFLQHYLALMLAKEPTVSHLFRDYRDAFADGVLGSVEEAISDFVHHAMLYREFDEAKEGDAGDLRQTLHVLDATVPFSLVLGIYARTTPGADRDAMFRTLDSYFMRRFLCGVSTKRYNQTMTALVNHLNRVGWTNDALQAALLSYEGNSACWPDDSFIYWRTLHRPAYGSLRGYGIGYVLGRMERFMRTTKSETSWNVRTPGTIEHLMPQSWAAHWPLPEETKEAHSRREELLNQFGNLTMLTQKLNSSISNSPWQEKKLHLRQHTVLLLNAELLDREHWTEEQIVQRSELMVKRFCQMWPRPAGMQSPEQRYLADEDGHGEDPEAN